MRRVLTFMVVANLIGACSPAPAVKIDPQNDIHCSVLSFYFYGLAKHDGAPDAQILATKALQDWYAAKLQSDAGNRYSDPALAKKNIGPILDAVKANPATMRDAMRICTNRAASDPTFANFARSYSSQ